MLGVVVGVGCFGEWRNPEKPETFFLDRKKIPPFASLLCKYFHVCSQPKFCVALEIPESHLGEASQTNLKLAPFGQARLLNALLPNAAQLVLFSTSLCS